MSKENAANTQPAPEFQQLPLFFSCLMNGKEKTFPAGAAVYYPETNGYTLIPGLTPPVAEKTDLVIRHDNNGMPGRSFFLRYVFHEYNAATKQAEDKVMDHTDIIATWDEANPSLLRLSPLPPMPIPRVMRRDGKLEWRVHLIPVQPKKAIKTSVKIVNKPKKD